MKKGWEIKDLEKVCNFQNGFAFKSKTFKENGVPVVRISNIQNESIESKGFVFIDMKDYAQDLSKYKIRKGDILIAMSGGTTGKIGIHRTEEVLLLNQRVGLFRPKDKLNKDFLYYYLSTKVEESLAISAGAAQPNLSTEQIKGFQIPLPPLPEQQRIVSILDHCFDAIDKAKANAEQNLQNARELFESYLQGVFEKKGEGWETKTLGSLCKFSQGIQRDIKFQSENQGENQVRFLRIIDFTQGCESPRYIDDPGSKYILTKDDVSLVRYGASTGFVCRGISGALANNMFRVIPNDLNKLSNDFLYIYLLSPIFQSVIKGSMGGAAMPAISFGLIRDIPFPFPKLKQQAEIVKRLEKVKEETQKLEFHYQKRINDLEELKKSILQKAFAGELKTEKMMEEFS